ncbi:hypothetical protein DFH06DRAFT_1160147 [Mycena polygramma]|nr:hypothetical protein DFH06DRAFT_1160147 [Mycena polygramma]
MRSAFAPLLVVASLAGVALSQLTIITPYVLECQPTLITWSGGTRTVNDANDQATILVNFGTLSNTSLTWTINQPAGTNCQLFIKDSTGAPQNSAPFVVSAGSTGCLGGSSSSGSAPASSVGTSAPVSSTKASSTPVSTPASSTPAVSTPAVSTPGASTTPASASSTRPASSAASVSGSSPSASPTNAALGSNVPAAAAAAALGVVFAALF